MIPYRPPERAGGTESFTRCRAQTLSPSGEPGVRVERTECRQSESPKPEKSKRDAGTDNSVLSGYPGNWVSPFPSAGLRVYPNLRFPVFLFPLSRSSGQCRQCRRLLPERHLGQLLGLKRDARIGAAYRELCGLWAPEARHRHGPLRGLSQAACLSFRPLAPGAGRRNWLLRRRFGLLLVAANGGYLSVTGAEFPRLAGRRITMTVAVYSPRRGHLSLHWVYVGLCGGHGTSSGLGAHLHYHRGVRHGGGVFLRPSAPRQRGHSRPLPLLRRD
ncbi:hypothetical protein NDU88_006457 [Pleurodeles waltl]|uniref:Uncharacterized protein n=1 Tax=Pleurodeles waltl TaxID=8319 RepID=A0AAV7MFT4_PLEWA|nr:hypothetical protein NDU88_006457 [Pleurodeles waltl]